MNIHEFAASRNVHLIGDALRIVSKKKPVFILSHKYHLYKSNEQSAVVNFTCT